MPDLETECLPNEDFLPNALLTKVKTKFERSSESTSGEGTNPDSDPIEKELMKFSSHRSNSSDNTHISRIKESINQYSFQLQELLYLLAEESSLDDNARMLVESHLLEHTSHIPETTFNFDDNATYISQNLAPIYYPNEHLSKILIDNYALLFNFASTSFNLTLSSHITKFMVELVYSLECWEIYHLVVLIPNISGFFKLVGIEVAPTAFGSLVKPPENYFEFNLRQGLQYPFPFPFYNYSYHTLESSSKKTHAAVNIKPYIDITLKASKPKKRKSDLKRTRNKQPKLPNIGEDPEDPRELRHEYDPLYQEQKQEYDRLYREQLYLRLNQHKREQDHHILKWQNDYPIHERGSQQNLTTPKPSRFAHITPMPSYPGHIPMPHDAQFHHSQLQLPPQMDQIATQPPPLYGVPPPSMVPMQPEGQFPYGLQQAPPSFEPIETQPVQAQPEAPPQQPQQQPSEVHAAQLVNSTVDAKADLEPVEVQTASEKASESPYFAQPEDGIHEKPESVNPQEPEENSKIISPLPEVKSELLVSPEPPQVKMEKKATKAKKSEKTLPENETSDHSVPGAVGQITNWNILDNASMNKEYAFMSGSSSEDDDDEIDGDEDARNSAEAEALSALEGGLTIIPSGHEKALEDDISKKTNVKRTGAIHQCYLTDPLSRSPCMKIFYGKNELLRHQEFVHATKKKIYKCLYCSRSGSNKVQSYPRHDSLARHIRRKHGVTGKENKLAVNYAKENVETIDDGGKTIYTDATGAPLPHPRFLNSDFTIKSSYAGFLSFSTRDNNNSKNAAQAAGQLLESPQRRNSIKGSAKSPPKTPAKPARAAPKPTKSSPSVDAMDPALTASEETKSLGVVSVVPEASPHVEEPEEIVKAEQASLPPENSQSPSLKPDPNRRFEIHEYHPSLKDNGVPFSFNKPEAGQASKNFQKFRLPASSEPPTKFSIVPVVPGSQSADAADAKHKTISFIPPSDEHAMLEKQQQKEVDKQHRVVQKQQKKQSDKKEREKKGQSTIQF